MYTFSLYSRGDLLTDCYGNFGDTPLCGNVCNGVAPTRDLALRYIADLRKTVTVADSVILWRNGKAIKVAA